MPTQLGVLSCYLLGFSAFFSLVSSSHLHQAGHNHHHAIHHHQRANANLSAAEDLHLSDLEQLVKQAHEELAKINAARIAHPAFNTYEFLDPLLLKEEKKPADPLDYQGTGSPNSTSRRRRAVNSTDDAVNARPYTIPPELAEAARVLAEASPQQPLGDHSEVAASIKKKYMHSEVNDTNVPKALTKPEGLLGVFHGEEVKNGTEQVQKRAFGYWMADIQQRGASPFAPAGYKVWRNVKDYGAKGDGKTDDTVAINKAISDGGRCGVNCGSSTIYPAVIWFPPGTYLVSSPIIQYYNTQFLGDPHNVPTILAAASFVGLGVITSDVYVADNEEWYLNTNNFLRSIRNFKMDIRLTDPSLAVCAIHWQVAQGTSLENIEFYMLYNSDVPKSTQQGIYMENGSGGFLADLTFVGGKFGAYFGNQQFTSSHLVFTKAETALQVHWDWAWTMQDYVIESCTNGLTIVGGAGGPKSTGQGVGSLILTDAVIANTQNGIITSLFAENSTSFLLQNVGFFNVKNAIQDKEKNKVLLAGGNEVYVESWGFGMTTDSAGKGSFINGANIASNRSDSLLGTSYDKMKPNYFTRRRPKYYDLPTSSILDVKALGARGDGKSDDTAVLNSILDGAANTSSIVYFPFGVYKITDTLKVPVGSRIIGQAWSQIMANGAKFADEMNPRPAVQVGVPDDIGIVEIQDMMFTVAGATAGAILVQWNVHETTKGSVGLWDSHFRVGGAIGTNLQKTQCPKLTGKVNPNCKAASLLLHLTPKSSAYLENVWVWVADHDLDVISQDQIDVYSGRGVLIESELAWLWGTASEHNVLYQYQLSNAKNILMAMIQTESPYFQPTPYAPQPFKTGLFPNDPGFKNCSETSEDVRCAFSWAVRIIDSTSIYILGSGIYSWFSKYSQECLKTEDCQTRGIEIQQSHNIWIYNLCTKAIVEMVSPLGAIPTYARDNVNGFLSSILAWLQGSSTVSGKRRFTGYQIYSSDGLESLRAPDTCKSALTQNIYCDDATHYWIEPGVASQVGNLTLVDSMCDAGCGESLQSWFRNTQTACRGYNVSEADATLTGGLIWARYNQTCLKDTTEKKYCTEEIFPEFKEVSSIKDMPKTELCSYCWVENLRLLQGSSYTRYDDAYKADLEYVNSQCGLSAPTAYPPGLVHIPSDQEPFCLSDKYTTTESGDTCDSIAAAQSISSIDLLMANQDKLISCSSIQAGIKLCLPLPCRAVYVLRDGDTCSTIEWNDTVGILPGDLRLYNSWLNHDCSNLQSALATYGRTICLGPQGTYNATPSFPGEAHVVPDTSDGYSWVASAPPETSSVAAGTTMKCGRWHVATEDDSCASICLEDKITISLFLEINPSLGATPAGCTSKLKIGLAYCSGPLYLWNETFADAPTSSTSATSKPPITSSNLPEPDKTSMAASPSATPEPICAENGYDKQSPAAFLTTNSVPLQSFTGCIQLCKSMDRCASIGLGMGACILYDGPMGPNLTPDPNSPYAFWDSSCTTVLYNCELPGYDKGSPAAYLVSTLHPSPDECRQYCLSESRCASYASGNGECLLYAGKVAGNVAGSDSSPYYFSDLECGS